LLLGRVGPFSLSGYLAIKYDDGNMARREHHAWRRGTDGHVTLHSALPVFRGMDVLHYGRCRNAGKALIMARRKSAEERALDKALADLDRRAVAAALDAIGQHDGAVAHSAAVMELARVLREHGRVVATLRGELAGRIADDDHLSMSELAPRSDIQEQGAQLVRAARNARAEQ
jgi:hypothetical protein